MITVQRSCELPAPASRVWDAAKSPQVLREITRGLLAMPELAHRTLPWQQGESVDLGLRLFGVLPFSRHTIRVVEVDDAAMRLRSDESGGPVRVWRHTIEVRRDGPRRCRYTDRIDLDAGPLTPAVAGFAHVLFAMRPDHAKRAGMNATSATARRPDYDLAQPSLATSCLRCRHVATAPTRHSLRFRRSGGVRGQSCPRRAFPRGHHAA